MVSKYNTELKLNNNQNDESQSKCTFYKCPENNAVFVHNSDDNLGDYSIEVTDTKIEFMQIIQGEENFFGYFKDEDKFYLYDYNVKNNITSSKKINPADGDKYTYETCLFNEDNVFSEFFNIHSETPAKNMCCELFKLNTDILNQIIENIRITKGEDISELVFNSQAVQELKYDKIYIKKIGE